MSVFGGYGQEVYDEQELVQELMAERAKRIEVEEECDTLALANMDLRAHVHELEKKLADALKSGGSTAPSSLKGSSSSNKDKHKEEGKLEDVDDEDMLVQVHENKEQADLPLALPSDGGGSTCQRQRLVLPDACSGTNPLSVAFAYLPRSKSSIDSSSDSSSDSREGDDETTETFIACGGVDKRVSLYDLRGTKRAQWELSGPVLALAVCCTPADGGPHLLAAACMDGSAYVINIDLSTTSTLPDASEAEALHRVPLVVAHAQVQLLEKHSKWAVGVQFSPCGSFLATLGHDHQAHLYTRVRAAPAAAAAAAAEYVQECGVRCTSASLHYEPLGVVLFPNTPEAFLFVPALCRGPRDAGYRLLVAVRGSSHLQSVSLSHTKMLQSAGLNSVLPVPFVPAVTNFLGLNEQVFDTHLSFAPLQLSLSPDGKHLLVATDKDFHFALDASYFANVTDEEVSASSSNLQEQRSRRQAVLVGHNGDTYSKPALCWSPDSQYLYTNSDTDSAVMAHHFPHAVLRAPAGSAPVRTLSGGHKGIVRAVSAHRTRHWVLTAAYDHSVILWE